jgi:putative spermidine/putrescine transport system ATP-binding protein
MRTAPAGESSLPIRIQGLAKAFGSYQALREVDLDIAAGEFVTLLGPSGSGKTTLLNLLAGFLRPDAGQVYFGEREVTLLAPQERNLGVVFQNYALFPHMSVAQNVAFPLQARKVPPAERERRVAKALDLVQLSGFGARRVEELSGGQKQRVALARAVVFEPKIILMDEPLSALDKQLRELMQIELRHLHAKLGSTTVYVTHDQREALTMSDRVAVLNQGRILQVDSPQRLYEQPSDAFVARFVGESTLLPVERAGGRRIRLAGTVLEARAEPPAAGDLLLALRAEKMLLLPDGAPPSDVLNLLPAIVTELVYQGDALTVFVRLESGASVAVRQPARHGEPAPQPGMRTVIGIPPEHTVVVGS